MESCFYQAKVQLSSVLEREECLRKKNEALEKLQTDEICSTRLLLEEREVNLQEVRKELCLRQQELDNERRFRQEELRRQNFRIEQRKALEAKLADVQRRLDAVTKDKTAKETLCAHLRCQLQSKDGQLQLKEEEVKKLLQELAQERELHHASVSQSCELRQKMKAIEESLGSKEADLSYLEETAKKLSSELSQERQLHHVAVSEACELRQKVKSLEEANCEFKRLEEFWKSERDMWYMRSNHLEDVNGKLHQGLKSLVNNCELRPPIEHSPETRSPNVCCPVRKLHAIETSQPVASVATVAPIQPIQVDVHMGGYPPHWINQPTDVSPTDLSTRP